MNKSNVHVRVNTNEFTWNQEEGLFTFDGAPALLFWDSAIELFLQTIEEVSGSDVSTTVYEATGFRMGLLVSSYYEGRLDSENILKEYSDIYRNAGWGNVKFSYFSFEEKKVIVQLTNSWEHRIFDLGGKKQAGVILPSHWAGVFSGLFGENMWYKIVKSQIDGFDYDEIEIFPSAITPNQNIHNLARQKEQQYIYELETKVKKRTEELNALVKDLSSPVIPVLEGILVIPLMGKFNEDRINDLIEKALIEFTRHKASYLLIDLTGINSFDDYTVLGLEKLMKSVKLLGGSCVVVGISAELSIQITKSQVDMRGFKSFSTLQHGVQYALEQTGFDIVPRK